jgi:hypothetical protein
MFASSFANHRVVDLEIARNMGKWSRNIEHFEGKGRELFRISTLRRALRGSPAGLCAIVWNVIAPNCASVSGDHRGLGFSLYLQSGYGSPASRLMTMACATRRKTATSIMTNALGFEMMPSETMSVVAPAGG